jgi:hypothetical protein
MEKRRFVGEGEGAGRWPVELVGEEGAGRAPSSVLFTTPTIARQTHLSDANDVEKKLAYHTALER